MQSEKNNDTESNSDFNALLILERMFYEIMDTIRSHMQKAFKKEYYEECIKDMFLYWAYIIGSLESEINGKKN